MEWYGIVWRKEETPQDRARRAAPGPGPQGERQPSPRAAASPPRRRRRSLMGFLLRFSFVAALWGAFGLAALFGYIWLTLSQKGVLTDPGARARAS